jgi:monovalent cation/hydrogen antiporter
MHHFEAIILILAVVITLLAITDRSKIPTPVILVLAGLGISFIPVLPSVALDPEVVFLLFLPPILFDAASKTSWRDFKAEIRPISALAITLVFLTMVTVAAACHFFIPGFSWPMGLVLGAIISPPDAVAATNITKKLGLNKRVITILEGESLVNDASALIAYRFAVGALATGTFLLYEGSIDFLIVVSGGLLIGCLVGYAFIWTHKKILDNSIISTSLSLLTPFLAYLIAENLNTSGILSVVSAGLLISSHASEIFSYQTRIRNRSVWDTLIFLLNGFIFILIGLQLPLILRDLSAYTAVELLLYGAMVSFVTILVRIIWVFSAAFLMNSKGQDTTWKNVSIIAWTGTRGVVSLATALALPLTLSNGDTFPQRSLILFLAFVVIFVTLVLQGVSLPLLVRILRIKFNTEVTTEEQALRLFLATSVVSFIDHDFPLVLTKSTKAHLRHHYSDLAELLSNDTNIDMQQGSSESDSSTLMAHLTITDFQRKLLIDCHKTSAYSQSAIRRVEQELDHEELHLNRLTNHTNDK